jgi:serine phosphatase RsbU (regulator of sigma subunit)
MAKYTLRAFASQGMTPVEVVTRANVALARFTTDDLFSTLFYAVLDMAAGTLTYVNAGHEPAQWVTAAGSLDRLETTGPLLGAFDEAQFEEVTVPVRGGELLTLYTDGLTDIRNENGVFFGEAGVRKVLTALRPETAAQIADALNNAAVQFAAGEGLRDDIAILVLKLAPAAS